VSQSEDVPLFAPNGELIFRGSEGPASYLYRIDKGEGVSEKVNQDAIVETQSVSADGKWVITQIALPGKEALRGVVAFPIRGGSPIRLCRGLCFVSWRRDAKFMYVHLPGTSQQGELGKTFVVPVGPVDPFSQLPDSGIQSEADLLKSGIKTLEGTISPGPDSTRYAFTKHSVHRNIYRVPTP